MITFIPGRPNQLLLNPKMSVEEKKVLAELSEKFAESVSPTDFFLIASSGSSKTSGESVKLIALSYTAILNSANRFNRFFKAGIADAWGLVLPTFHVAGLAILARAHLVGAKVFEASWQPENLKEWSAQNEIAFMSFVPAQVYDLVQRKITPAVHIKKVFVGAGHLNPNLKAEFIQLGWPVVETYGMTETASMIAVREGKAKFFTLLPGVEVHSVEGLLHVQCDSLAHSAVQKKQDQLKLSPFSKEGFQTQDQIRLHAEGLEFLGRSSEYFKILGEGVSLLELRSKLEGIALAFNLTPSQIYLMVVDDSRLENLLVLVVENSVESKVAEHLVIQFNQSVRAYERIHKLVRLEKIPLTELGKVKVSDLKQDVLNEINRRSNDKKI